MRKWLLPLIRIRPQFLRQNDAGHTGTVRDVYAAHIANGMAAFKIQALRGDFLRCYGAGIPSRLPRDS